MVELNTIAFLHIGKTAGTQIQHITQQLKSYGLNIIKCNHDIKLKNLKNNIPYFFSIRKPTSRFKSGFYSRKRKGQPRIYSEWTKFEAIAFQQFEHANELAESLMRNDEVGFNARIAIKSIRHTGMQQVDWFEGASVLEQRPPLHIIRQENFKIDMQELIKSVGLEVNVNDLISTNTKTAHKNDYKDTPELSQLAVENLEKWYIQDHFFYNQCEHWLKQKNINFPRC